MQNLTFLGAIYLLAVITMVDAPRMNKIIMWTPIFEWYVLRCGSKNGAYKYTCLKEIGLRSQNMLSILGSIVNMIWGIYRTT